MITLQFLMLMTKNMVTDWMHGQEIYTQREMKEIRLLENYQGGSYHVCTLTKSFWNMPKNKLNGRERIIPIYHFMYQIGLSQVLR